MGIRTIDSAEELEHLVGEEPGLIEWRLVDQAGADAFADPAGDHQWIHAGTGMPVRVAISEVQGAGSGLRSIPTHTIAIEARDRLRPAWPSRSPASRPDRRRSAHVRP